MKIRERIEQIDDDVQISIGSLSSFIFIGTKQELFEDVKRLDEEIQGTFSISLRTAIRNLNALSDDEKMLEAKQRLSERISILTNYLSNYVPILDREIKENYPREVDGGGEVIICEGIETGSIWFRHEYLIKSGRMNLRKVE